MSKVMTPDETATVTPWQVPSLEQIRSSGLTDSAATFTRTDFGAPAKAPVEPPKGYDEGFAEGLLEGERRATATRDQEKAELLSVLQAMARPLEQINEAVESELVALSLAAAKMILRREIADAPSHIAGLIREAVNSLPASTTGIRVHLHPNDAAVVREVLGAEDSGHPWQIQDDASLQRGDCHVHTDTSFVDAGIDALINRLAAEMTGGQRSTDMNEKVWDESA